MTKAPSLGDKVVRRTTIQKTFQLLAYYLNIKSDQITSKGNG